MRRRREVGNCNGCGGWPNPGADNGMPNGRSSVGATPGAATWGRVDVERADLNSECCLERQRRRVGQGDGIWRLFAEWYCRADWAMAHGMAGWIIPAAGNSGPDWPRGSDAMAMRASPAYACVQLDLTRGVKCRGRFPLILPPRVGEMRGPSGDWRLFGTG